MVATAWTTEETNPLPSPTIFGARLQELVGEALDDVAEHCLEIARQNLQDKSPYGISDGPTYESGKVVRTVDADGSPARDVVFGGAAKWVEFGRRPGKAPPPDILTRWVERKLGLQGSEAEGIAYVIGQHIAERGIPPTFFLLLAADAVFDEQIEKVVNAVRRLFEGRS